MNQKSQSNQIPFIPLVIDQPNPNDLKNILQKQIKSLSPEEYHFFSHLLSTNTLYQELTSIQKQLNNDPQFSLWKLFQYFDINGDRKLQFDDFYISLQKLDIVLKKEELYMLFQKLGGEDDQIISYAEFSEIFKFEKAPLWNIPKTNQDYVLNQEQQQIVHQLFSIYMKMEKSVQYLREQIGKIEVLDAIFRKIDSNSNGYLTFPDLIKYLTAKGINVQKNDFKRVFYRMQFNKSSRVNYDEFLREFSTKENYIQYQQTQMPQQQMIESVVPMELQEQQQQQQQQQQQSQVITKQSILNDYLQQPMNRRSMNESDDSIRLPGFTRYVFQNN